MDSRNLINITEREQLLDEFDPTISRNNAVVDSGVLNSTYRTDNTSLLIDHLAQQPTPESSLGNRIRYRDEAELRQRNENLRSVQWDENIREIGRDQHESEAADETQRSARPGSFVNSTSRPVLEEFVPPPRVSPIASSEDIVRSRIPSQANQSYEEECFSGLPRQHQVCSGTNMGNPSRYHTVINYNGEYCTPNPTRDSPINDTFVQSGNHTQSSRDNMIKRAVHRTLTPMWKWGIRFRGDGVGLSFNDFVSQVEMKAAGQNMHPDEIMFEFCELLDGPAKTWYRAFFRRYHNWNELRDGMRNQFLPPDYDFRLKRQIEDRLQGPNENFGMFRANMEMLFSDLSNPISEREKLDILLRNMDEYYLDKVADRGIVNVDELEKFCRNLELNKNIINQRRNKITAPVEPAYNAIANNNAGSNIRQRNFGRVSEICENLLDQDIPQSIQAITIRPKRKCWNCQKEGHTFNECRQPRTRIFCFKCGKDNTTITDCSCSSGNSQSRPAQ